MSFGVFNFLGSKFIYTQFGRGGAEESKTLKLLLSEQINRKSEVVSKNQALKLINREYMGFPPLFDLKSVRFLP